MAIIIAIILAGLLNLAFYEGIALGAAWLIEKIFDINVNYGLVAVIVGIVWLLLIIIKLLFAYGVYKGANKL